MAESVPPDVLGEEIQRQKNALGLMMKTQRSDSEKSKEEDGKDTVNKENEVTVNGADTKTTINTVTVKEEPKVNGDIVENKANGINESVAITVEREKSEGAMTTAESVTSTESVVTVIAKGNNIGEESMVDLTQYSNGDVPEETVNESLMSLAGSQKNGDSNDSDDEASTLSDKTPVKSPESPVTPTPTEKESITSKPSKPENIIKKSEYVTETKIEDVSTDEVDDTDATEKVNTESGEDGKQNDVGKGQEGGDEGKEKIKKETEDGEDDVEVVEEDDVISASQAHPILDESNNIYQENALPPCYTPGEITAEDEKQLAEMQKSFATKTKRKSVVSQTDPIDPKDGCKCEHLKNNPKAKTKVCSIL